MQSEGIPLQRDFITRRSRKQITMPHRVKSDRKNRTRNERERNPTLAENQHQKAPAKGGGAVCYSAPKGKGEISRFISGTETDSRGEGGESAANSWKEKGIAAIVRKVLAVPRRLRKRKGFQKSEKETNQQSNREIVGVEEGLEDEERKGQAMKL